MSADAFHGFFADDVLDSACIAGSVFFVHAKSHKIAAKDFVTAVYGFRHFLARVCESYMTGGVYVDVAVFAQLFHSDADAGLGKLQLAGYINRTDITLSKLEYEDSF